MSWILPTLVLFVVVFAGAFGLGEWLSRRLARRNALRRSGAVDAARRGRAR